MGYRLVWVLAALCCAGLSAVADEKNEKTAQDLQGTWQAVDLEGNGEKRPAEEVNELKVVIRGDEIYAVKPQGEDPRSHFSLDPSKEPKAIDIIPQDGPSKGKIAAGIYALENGRLKLCINIFGKDSSIRPTEFKTHEGDGVVFVTLEHARQK